MKFNVTVLLEAPSYYVDNISGRCDTDKCLILRNLHLENSDYETESSLLRQLLPSNTNIIDLTNNELHRIPALPNSLHLHTLLMARNRIKRLDGRLLPRGLVHLNLAMNGLEQLGQLDGLLHAPKSIRYLLLKGNPLVHLQSYREHVLALMPQLEVLDNQKVTALEKQNAKKEHKLMFNRRRKNITSSSTRSEDHDLHAEDERDKSTELMNGIIQKLTPERRKEIKAQLLRAKSLSEILRLEQMLSSGTDL